MTCLKSMGDIVSFNNTTSLPCIPDMFPTVVQSADLSNSPYAMPTALGTDYPSNFFNFYDVLGQAPHNIDHALIADSSSPISNNPAINLEWALPPFISLSSPDTAPDDKLQDLLNTFPQSINTFNPSIMISTPPTELLQSMNNVSTQSERAVKQQKLLEIQEAARRLEAELAAMYVI